jgi:hypothetical protein
VPGLFLNSFSYLDLYFQEKKLENPGKKNWKAHHSVVMLKKHLLQTYAAQRNDIPILVTPMCKTDVMQETTTKKNP